MEFFRSVNVDWMGKAKYFVTCSLILLVVGWISIYRTGGLRYGIDFRGGTLVYVRFASAPPINQIRKELQDAGLANSTIQQISDIANASSNNDVVIGLNLRGQGDESIDAGKQAILGVLQKTFGVQGAKPDFNSVTPSGMATFLTQKDPLSLGAAAGDRYNQLARQITDVRDKEHGGILTNFDDLKSVPAVNATMLGELRDSFSLGTFAIRDVEVVGPKVGAQLRRQAVFATLYALAGMLIYIAIRFEWVYGAAAVIAVFHDVLITLGLFSLFRFEISLTVIAALLTLVGYSMNDTIVIFDRVRDDFAVVAPRAAGSDRQQVHQSDAIADDSDERLDVPDGARPLPHGWGSSPQLLFCYGGGSFDRNILQFRHSRPHRSGLEQVQGWSEKCRSRWIRSLSAER